ncbi:hypothetical protein AB6A40_006600 [Gnathostoma spinigerum]|uniref:Uncharacterized protein n=1 Tax=Gnathostoma spinigerum TaxID=75299 RepID=A0ABD6EKW5_9BILA
MGTAKVQRHLGQMMYEVKVSDASGSVKHPDQLRIKGSDYEPTKDSEESLFERLSLPVATATRRTDADET